MYKRYLDHFQTTNSYECRLQVSVPRRIKQRVFQ